MENLSELNSNEMKEIVGGNFGIPIGLGGIILFANAVKAYYEGVEEGCKCALVNKNSN
jgi:hypothetical protein